MKNTIYILCFLLFQTVSFSQVGIGTTNPQADLDIRTTNPSVPLANSGIAIPQVDVIPSTGNRAGQFVYLTIDKSYYYFDGTVWQRLNLRKFALVKTVTSDYTLLETDASYVILVDSATDITLSIPAGLTEGHNVTVYQINTGKIMFSGSGTTVKNRLNRFTTAGQDASVGLIHVGSNIFYVTGDLVK